MRRFVVSLTAAGILAAATAAQAVPVSFKHAALNTDWTSAAVGGVGGGTGTITLSGVSGTVTKAYLYWHGINNSGIGAVYDNPSVTVNATPVTGASLGDATTNCWGDGSSRAFVADVTSLVTGDGPYVVAGLSSQQGYSANGASLIVLFDDGNPANNRDLVFFDGNDSNTINGFPGEDAGWHSVLGGINFQGGAVNAQTHSADGQRFDVGGLDDGPLAFSSAAGTVTIADAGGLWDGESVPDAGSSRAPNGSLWDLHSFDISAAFTTSGMYTLNVDGQDATADCLDLVVLLLDLQAGSVSCGNGIVDQGEQCDPGTQVQTCTAPAICTGQCICGCELDPQCDDADPCTADSCTRTSGQCVHTDICGTTTTTTTLPPTTTTLPITGACCEAGNCFVATAAQCEVGTYQGDGTNCDDPGICAACGDGLISQGEQCDDANTASGDGCDGKCSVEQCWVCNAPQVTTTTLGPTFPALPGPSVCTPDNGASCDDGDICTVGDTCAAGACDGNAVLIPAACRWVMVGDTGVQSRTRGETEVTGHVCGGRVRLGEFSATNGDAVGTLAAGVGIQISGHAVVTGDIITGGSAVRGKPRLTLLPGLTTDVVPGGSTDVQSGDPTAIYDTLGTNTRVADCASAQGDIAAGDSLLALLPPGTDLGSTLIPAAGTLTLTATNPGGLNVFDFKTLISATDGTLTLDGAGDANSVFVLRVKKKLDLRLRSKVVLTGAAVPGRVILYSQAKCRFGLEVTGAGTVFCPSGKLILNPRDQWQGALVGGRGRVELRDSGVLTHVPLQVGP